MENMMIIMFSLQIIVIIKEKLKCERMISVGSLLINDGNDGIINYSSQILLEFLQFRTII